MEEQEHKISSFIEQQEELKSTVSSFPRVLKSTMKTRAQELLYFKVPSAR